jgi:hypothetical protein
MFKNATSRSHHRNVESFFHILPVDDLVPFAGNDNNALLFSVIHDIGYGIAMLRACPRPVWMKCSSESDKVIWR